MRNNNTVNIWVMLQYIRANLLYFDTCITERERSSSFQPCYFVSRRFVHVTSFAGQMKGRVHLVMPFGIGVAILIQNYNGRCY